MKRKEYDFERVYSYGYCHNEKREGPTENWQPTYVIAYPDYPHKEVAEWGKNKPITKRQTIKIEFNYPLSHKVVLEFKNKKGFNYKDFYKAVYQGYIKIYKEEDKAVGNPGHIPGMLNRKSSNGPHGIWGHDISDLVLEGFTETRPGYFTLGIGS